MASPDIKGNLLLGSFFCWGMIDQDVSTGKFPTLTSCLTLPNLTARTSQASSATICQLNLVNTDMFTSDLYFFSSNAAHKLLSIFMPKKAQMVKFFVSQSISLFKSG